MCESLGDLKKSIGEAVNAAMAPFVIQLTSLVASIKGIENSVVALSSRVDSNEEAARRTEERLTALEERAEDSENRARRKNLLFFGVSDSHRESPADCVATIYDLASSAGVELGKFSVERAHRIGRAGRKPRPIIALFSFYEEKELVLGASKRLQTVTGVAVAQDFAPRTRTARTALYKRLKDERKLGRIATLAVDRLYVGRRGDHDQHTLIYNHSSGRVEELPSRRGPWRVPPRSAQEPESTSQAQAGSYSQSTTEVTPRSKAIDTLEEFQKDLEGFGVVEPGGKEPWVMQEAGTQEPESAPQAQAGSYSVSPPCPLSSPPKPIHQGKAQESQVEQPLAPQLSPSTAIGKLEELGKEFSMATPTANNNKRAASATPGSTTPGKSEATKGGAKRGKRVSLPRRPCSSKSRTSKARKCKSSVTTKSQAAVLSDSSEFIDDACDDFMPEV